METAFHQLKGEGVKAADVVAIHDAPRSQKTLLVAEFKDFDDPTMPMARRIKTAHAAVSDVVLRDIVRKVIDTLSGATFSHDAALQRCTELDGWRSSLGLRRTSLLVLVCVEIPRTQAIAHLAWTTDLQRRLRWLGPEARILVTTSARPFQGSGVRYRL